MYICVTYFKKVGLEFRRLLILRIGQLQGCPRGKDREGVGRVQPVVEKEAI